MCVCVLLNHTAMVVLDWRTPHEVCFGGTPDISNFLQFSFYEEIYYHDTLEHANFPDGSESCGHFVGIAENKGDKLAHWET